MNVTVTPAPKSALNVRVELPPERLDAAIAEAVRHLSQRTKIAGFRPGKAPRAMVERVVGAEAVLEEAMDHLVQRAYRDALREQDILPLTPAEVNVEQGEEGKPVIFSATVQVRP
jgi:trigger factor